MAIIVVIFGLSTIKYFAPKPEIDAAPTVIVSPQYTPAKTDLSRWARINLTM
ncbi:MAG: hypothetical protein WBA93_23695 [Microcoleaceae cyanobacterium]